MPGSHAGVTVKVKATPSSTYDPAKLQSVITRCLKDGATATRPVLGKQAVDDLKSILSSSMADDLIPTLFTTLCNVNEKQSQKHRQLALEFLSMVLKRHGGSSTFPSVFLKVLGHLLDIQSQQFLVIKLQLSKVKSPIDKVKPSDQQCRCVRRNCT